MAEPREQTRLDALGDRRKTVRISLADRAYTSFVRKLRWILPVTALSIVAVLMVWPKIETELADKRFAPATKIDKATLEQAATENRLINANFASVDSKGRPFTITSTEAVQENNNPDNIVLQNPKGTLKLDKDVTLTAQAKHGEYAQGRQHLNLMDDVILTRSDGTVMKTDVLFVNLMTNDAKTDTPVDISGPDGHLTAQGMDMQKGGAVTIFPGPARLILNARNSINPKGGS